MKLNILPALLLLCVAPATSAATMTLDECIDYALEHNLSVKSSIYDIEKGKIAVTSSKNAFLPTLNAQATQSFSFGRSTSEDNMKVSTNASNFGWSASAQVPLFDGLKNVRNLKGARLNLTALLLQSDAARDDVTLNVISAYLQVLLNRELAKVADTQVELARIEVERQQALVDAGKSPELDLIQARSTLAQDEVSLVEAQNDADLALLRLKLLLEMPESEGLDIVPLSDEAMLIATPEEVYRNAMERNSSILAKKQNLLIADNRVALARSGYLPSLSFGAQVGSSYTHMKLYPSDSFARQMRGNLQEYVGFTLSVPIFDAFATRNNISTAKVDRLMAQIDLEQKSSELYNTITQAYYQAEAARKKAEASRIAEGATKEALDAMTTKFNYGKANATEYEQAKNNYIKAASTTVQARYEYIIRTRILDFYNKTT